VARVAPPAAAPRVVAAAAAAAEYSETDSGSDSYDSRTEVSYDGSDATELSLARGRGGAQPAAQAQAPAPARFASPSPPRARTGLAGATEWPAPRAGSQSPPPVRLPHR
jgi:hypothetical protein